MHNHLDKFAGVYATLAGYKWLLYILFPLIVGFSLIVTHPFFGSRFVIDELHHVGQIELYIEGEFTQSSSLPMFPGFHISAFLLNLIFGNDSRFSFRLISLILGSLSILSFYLCAHVLQPAKAASRTVMFALLPIVFPYYFFVYTDVFSVALLLFTMYTGIKKRYMVSSFVFCLALFVRQTNIIWGGFLFIWTYVEVYGLSFNINQIKQHLQHYWLMVLTHIALAIFVWLNGGVVLGANEFHPLSTLHLGNIWFFFFVFPIIFLPALFFNGHIHSYSKEIFIIGILLSLACWFTFDLTHPWNELEGLLHNRILKLLVTNIWWRMLLIALIFISVTILFHLKFERPAHFILYPFAILSLLPLWMVEHRYLIPIFAFFLLFMPALPGQQENFLSKYISLLSLALFVGIWLGLYFP